METRKRPLPHFKHSGEGKKEFVQKMFDDISASIAKGTVKTVVIINDEKKSEPWLTTWAPNLEKIE